MGTVYEAIQENPRRRVALKMMRRGITSRSALRRFEFESQTLARLQHAHIAQVYEAGTHDDGYEGVPYFVMEYISSAKTLTQYAVHKELGTRERLALFLMVCDAVRYGHQKGIVHRDIKPSNILVNADGQPKIIDFGVARSTDSDLAVTTLQTDVGQLIGTLQYMSPEQCEADPSDIDARSDVYALGVTLYELLAGRPPYDIRKAAIHEAVRIIREEEPTKLSSFGKHLCGDIETISLKSLEKNRDHRYQSVVALGEDIQCYLDDEQISARPRKSAQKSTDIVTKVKRPWSLIVALISIGLFLVVCLIIGLVLGITVPVILFASDPEGACCYYDADDGWLCVSNTKKQCIDGGHAGIWYGDISCVDIDCTAVDKTDFTSEEPFDRATLALPVGGIQVEPNFVMVGEEVTLTYGPQANQGTPKWIRLDGGEIQDADQWVAKTTFSKAGDVVIRLTVKLGQYTSDPVYRKIVVYDK